MSKPARPGSAPKPRGKRDPWLAAWRCATIMVRETVLAAIALLCGYGLDILARLLGVPPEAYVFRYVGICVAVLLGLRGLLELAKEIVDIWNDLFRRGGRRK